MRKNLQHLQLNVEKTIKFEENLLSKSFLSNQEIFTKKEYSENDLLHMDFGAGFPPYLRGINSTMYVRNTWDIHENQSFTNPFEANTFYKKCIANGQKNISVVFDLPTQDGFDSDNNLVNESPEIQGVAIDTVEDMKILFDQIPLHEISVSTPMNTAILPLFAFYIVAAEEQGIKAEQLSGSILNEILFENKQIYSAEYLLAIFECVQKKIPKFNGIIISGFPINETTVAVELAYILAHGLEFIKVGLNKGLKIDDISTSLSFKFEIGMNHFTEIAKLRAARMIWSKLINSYHPENPKSLALQILSKTSERSAIPQNSFNNITRTCIGGAAAVFGGTQSLETNALSKQNKLALRTRIARNTQRYLQQETKITKTVDPWGGSYYLEYLTQNIIQNTWKHIEEIEKLGGFSKAIEAGYQKSQTAEVTTKNLFIKNDNTFNEQLKKLNEVKPTRNFENIKISLDKIKECSKNELEKLFELILNAAKNRATIGEICEAIENGNH